MSKSIPSFEEIQASEDQTGVAVPSYEEIQASESMDEPNISESINFDPSEMAVRSVRSGLKGATLGLSEPLAISSQAIAGTISEMLDNKEFKKAEDYLASLKNNYASELKRQSQFEQEYPTLTTGAEMTGGVLPFSPAAKVVSAMGKAFLPAVDALSAVQPTVKQAVKTFTKEAAITGLGAGALYQGAQELAEDPVTNQSALDHAKDIAEAGATGAVINPAIGAATTVGIVGASKAYTKAKQVASKALLSDPALRFNQIIFGPKVETQKKYINAVNEIESLPDNESVELFFDKVLTDLKFKEKINDESLSHAQENLTAIQRSLDRRVNEVKGEEKAKLELAQTRLREIKENLRDQLAIQKPDATVRTQEIKQSIQNPSMGPYVHDVEIALDEMKRLIGEKSRAATEVIDPSFSLEKQKLIDISWAELNKLFSPGTDKAATDVRKNAIQRVNSFIKNISEYPDVLNGEQVKDIIKQIDELRDDLKPGQFGSKSDVTFKGIRKAIDKILKEGNEEYRLTMEPVAEMADFLDEASAELSNPGKIEASLVKGIKNPRIGKILTTLNRYTNIDTITPMMEIMATQEAKKPGNVKAYIENDPVVKQLRQTESLVKLSQAENFDRAVFNSVKDTQAAQEIIQVKDLIESLKDPLYIEAKVMKAVHAGALEENAARDILKKHQQLREKIAKSLAGFAGAEKGFDALSKILRASDAPQEQAAATRLINSITQLPDAEFSEFFKLINLTDPKDFEKMVENLRVRNAMTFPRTQGSRRVQLMNAISGAIGAGLGAGISQLMGMSGAESLIPASLSSAIGAYNGAMLDEFGGRILKAHLRNLTQIEGVPTYKKLIDSLPMAPSKVLRTQIQLHVNELLGQTNPNEMVGVSNSQKDYLIQDIQRSNLSSIDKAKSINDLQKIGMIKGSILRKVMMEGAPKESQLDEVKKGLFERKPQSLRQDKPEILKKLSDRGPERKDIGREMYISEQKILNKIAEIGEAGGAIPPVELEAFENTDKKEFLKTLINLYREKLGVTQKDAKIVREKLTDNKAGSFDGNDKTIRIDAREPEAKEDISTIVHELEHARDFKKNPEFFKSPETEHKKHFLDQEPGEDYESGLVKGNQYLLKKREKELDDIREAYERMMNRLLGGQSSRKELLWPSKGDLQRMKERDDSRKRR